MEAVVEFTHQIVYVVLSGKGLIVVSEFRNPQVQEGVRVRRGCLVLSPGTSAGDFHPWELRCRGVMTKGAEGVAGNGGNVAVKAAEEVKAWGCEAGLDSMASSTLLARSCSNAMRSLNSSSVFAMAEVSSSRVARSVAAWRARSSFVAASALRKLAATSWIGTWQSPRRTVTGMASHKLAM